ncbi:hypothetical protein TcYC6_0028870 [Trypanosoma cruzi]|nr:hypothetical protein TcYC6_0028870 [Trypanosoma cruzi]
MPTECKYLSLLVISRVCRDTPFRRTRGVVVGASLSDNTVLFGCVIRLCGGSVEGEDVDGPRLPDCCVSFLLNALTKLLVLFCLLYRAWRPLEERCDGVDCQAAEEAVAALDVLRNFFVFQGYCREEDILCLLHFQESQWRDHGCGISLHEGLRSLIASTVRSVCLRPLPTHPAAFLSVNGKIHRHTEQVVGDIAARNALKALQLGNAASKDPAALGILLAPNFC